MKKKILLLIPIMFIFLLVGCNEQKENLNIYELSKEIDQIEANSINIEKAIVKIGNEVLEDELIDVNSIKKIELL